MDIRWKKFSRAMITKIIAFIIAILCFTCAVTIFIDIAVERQGDFAIALEAGYYQGADYIRESTDIVNTIRRITGTYKNENHILEGGTLTADELERAEHYLFSDFMDTSKSFNPNLSREENYQIFQEAYAEKISRQRTELIQEDLREYKAALHRLGQYQGLLYYALNDENELTNSTNKTKEYFSSFPSYMLFAGYDKQVFPAEITENPRYFWLASDTELLDQEDIIYIGFTEEFLSPRINKWRQDKNLVMYSLQQLAGFLAGLAAAFIYLVIVIGRKPEEEQGFHLNFIDRIYNDIKLLLCLALIAVWLGFINTAHYFNSFKLTFPVTMLISACGLILILSLVKHLKNRTFIKHTVTYTIFAKFFNFLKDIYDSGSVGVKIILIVVGYPLLVGATFFIFPITIGAAAWIALKKVKEFKAIKEGVRRVKEGELHYTINVSGKGEFGSLASDINSITDGLKKAVDNELKSERLKTELITNVSHDIRTPLTSIITYVDLLKSEKEPTRLAEYIEVIDQKSQRLKVLTEDLFEAAKASSGNIPVNYEEIDVVSLITQGLGELDDKIKEHKLEFKLSHPKDKVIIKADGKLLWRAIENLLANIFKYALEGSRVYIDILESEAEVILNIKNISAYELNISATELMERFKRGDESRSSQGSGLGLSIAKSLIEIQKGRFSIEIDGDLFKAIIKMAR